MFMLLICKCNDHLIHDVFGRADLPPPTNNRRYLEPPQLMVTFQGVYEVFTSVTYESKANLTNFVSSWENDEFVCFHTQNEDKSQKISTCIRNTHKHTCIRKYVGANLYLTLTFHIGSTFDTHNICCYQLLR